MFGNLLNDSQNRIINANLVFDCNVKIQKKELIMYNWLKKFVKNKLQIADYLYSGECDGGYPEATLILSSVLSGISSELWPGSNIDKRRFVETMVQFTNSESLVKNISIPILIEHLKHNKDIDTINILKENKLFYDTYQVLTNREVDYPEDYCLRLLSSIDLKLLRNFSYASLFYQKVRSGFVHEYKTSKFASAHPQTQRNVKISYINSMEFPNHRIYFHYDWIKEVINQIVMAIEKNNTIFPREKPKSWWLDG